MFPSRAHTHKYIYAAREHHGARARCNFDEEGKRTSTRLKVSNSAHARARYLLRDMAEADAAAAAQEEGEGKIV